jgi:Domain of unknown function DUF1828
MNIKDNLCEAFCGMLSVTKVPAGFAVGTGHEGMNGDHIGFYVVGPNVLGKYHIQDDGLSMAALEAEGADLANKSRNAMFSELRDQYAVLFDEDSGELKSVEIEPEQIGAESLRFMAFMLRVQDLLLTTHERTMNTFRAEAEKIIREIVGTRAQIFENYVINSTISDVPAELAIIAPNRPPVALFFGVDDKHVMEALLLQSYAANKHVNCAVIALLETESAVTSKIRQRANNHLEAVPTFRGDERAACARIVREAIGFDPTVH